MQLLASCIRWICINEALPQVYVSQCIVPKLNKNGEVEVHMQRIIQNAGLFSRLVIDLKKILRTVPLRNGTKLGLN